MACVSNIESTDNYGETFIPQNNYVSRNFIMAAPGREQSIDL